MFFQVLKWSFTALLSGKFPQKDWEGNPQLALNELFCDPFPSNIFLATLFAAALVSVQGDLEYFASALNLPRWNVLAGGCPVCKCTRDGECSWMFFQNWEHTAAMEWKPHEWLSWEGKSSCALFQIPGVTGCCVMLDWMHCKYLSRPWKVGNRRARRAAKRGAEVNFFRKGKVPTMYEFACSPESMMGYVNGLYDIPHVRLCKEMYNLEDPDTISQVVSQLKCALRICGVQSPAPQAHLGSVLISFVAARSFARSGESK